MSSKDLIQSGILELYALGLCSEEESSRVEEALRSDEQVRKEYDEICEALDHLAAEQSVEPPQFLKEDVLKAIDALDEVESPLSKPVETEEKITPQKTIENTEPKVVALPVNRWQRIAVAAMILLTGSIAANYSLYTRWADAEEEAAVLRNNNMFLTDENGIIQSKYDVMKEQYAFLGEKNLKTVALKGTEAYPDLEAMVFWDNTDGDVYVVPNGLASLGEDEQYQLWALDNGVPKDAGMVPVDFADGGAYHLKNISSSQAFAITIEKKGGSPTPNLEKLVVIGNL